MTDAQSALAKVREALPKGSESVEWEWWTSNSFRRLSVRGSTVDGGVMYAYVAHDGQPDISIRQSDMALIAACSPANIAAILAHVDAQAAEIKRLRKLAMTTYLFEEAPCFLCGYNGPGYYQPEQHPCAALYHEAMEEQR